MKPFIDELPEYDWILQNYWNNANKHTVLDPFGAVKYKRLSTGSCLSVT
ncbi:MAG: hypothetical protein ACR5LD_06880 [Symbiopectobacterium sp.]